MMFSNSLFKDRRDAGRQLAAALLRMHLEDPIVLALPRGGVPVACEVAQALHAPLDVLIVRKLGAPGHPELGLGAVVDGRVRQSVLNENVIRMVNPPPGYIEAETQRQIVEIERRRKLYCGDREPLPIGGRSVVVVDDGVATGGTMKTALAALAKSGARKVVYAIPVAPEEVLPELRQYTDEGVCLHAPQYFRAVSLYYEDFRQTTDEEVIELLAAFAAGPNHDPGNVDDIGATPLPDAMPAPDDPKWMPSAPS